MTKLETKFTLSLLREKAIQQNESRRHYLIRQFLTYLNKFSSKKLLF